EPRERSPIPTNIRLRWSRGRGRRFLQTFGSAGAEGRGRRFLQTFGSAGAEGEVADSYRHSAPLEPRQNARIPADILLRWSRRERSPIPTNIRLRWSRGRGRRFLPRLSGLSRLSRLSRLSGLLIG